MRPPLGQERRWVVLFIMTSFAEQGGFCGATIRIIVEPVAEWRNGMNVLFLPAVV